MAAVIDSVRRPFYHAGNYGHHPGVDCTPPPPIPARLHPHHTVREPRPATALGHADTDSGYLAPLAARRGRGALVDAVPPLPPRQPLRRSVSLTHRAPPDPRGTDPGEDGPPGGQTTRDHGHEPTLDEVLASLRRSRVDSLHPPPLSPALSAPLLGQVVPVTRWPLPSSVTGRVPTSPVRVVPLTRWPFSDSAAVPPGGRLTMDGIVMERAGTPASRNEYVDAPSAVTGVADPASGRGRRRRVGRKPATTPGGAVVLPDATTQGEGTDSARRRRGGSGLAVKMRRLLSCVGTSPTSSPDSSSGDDLDGGLPPPHCVGCRGGGTVCRRCGRCSDCVVGEQSSTLRRARSVVDVVSCMCCVRFLFYHCLKDDAGDELDCSDEPCACSDRPRCAVRWAVMGALLPCLPCLCLYPPLRCGVDAACSSCRCTSAPRNSRHPGLKGLLESESSST